MKKILILGSINIDLTIETPYIPAAGETVTGRNFLVNPGGKGANQAVAARRLGGTVCFSGCVGDDAFGRESMENFQRCGLDISGVRTVENCPTGCAVIAVCGGDNRIILDRGANAAVTRAELEAQNTLLASFTTKTTSSKSRNTNIRLCSEAFNGYVVAPGEIFSINGITGPRTTAKGYKEAGSIQNGIMIQEPGGGVCQVSSTLFNAVVRAGMEIVERHGHSWPSDYVKIGMDAAIDYPAKDFKFKNISDSPIYLVSSFEDRQLTIEVYGKPMLDERVTIDLRSTTDGTIKRGEDSMVFDASLAPGTTKTVRKGRDGKKSTTYIQYIRDGKVFEEKVLFPTTYPAIRAIINYGPDLVPEETPGGTVPSETNNSNVYP